MGLLVISGLCVCNRVRKVFWVGVVAEEGGCFADCIGALQAGDVVFEKLGLDIAVGKFLHEPEWI